METMEELKPQHRNLEEEKFEDIGELEQEEDGAPDVEMKPLPKGLKYEFLGDGKTFPVIIRDGEVAEFIKEAQKGDWLLD